MIALPNTVRLFPLGEVVLFPDTLLPLQVFEPRYRKMLADALADDGLIGMTLVCGTKGPIVPAPVDVPDRPDVYDVGCAGKIVEHEPQDDGRAIIVLRGTVKFRIHREIESDEPYRIAEAQALYEAPVPAEHMRQWRDELRVALESYVTALSADSSSLDGVFAKLEVEGLVNYLSANLPFDPVEKQGLLECPTVERRFRRLVELVQFKAAEARLGLDSDREADS